MKFACTTDVCLAPVPDLFLAMKARFSNLTLPSSYIPPIIVGVCIFAILLGMGIAAFDVEGKEYGIVLIVILVIPVIITTDERLLQFSFGGWILTMAAGPRAFYVTPALPIHVSEALAWLLFILVTVRDVAVHRNLRWQVPVSLTLFLAWVTFQAFVRPGNPNIESVIFELKQYLIAIPVFGLVFHFVHSHNWRRYFWLLTASGVVLVLSGLLVRSGSTGAADISARLTVPGWVTVYAFFLVLLVGFVLAEFALAESRHKRVLVGIVLFVVLFGIYEAAYRGIWLATLAGLGIFALFHLVLGFPIIASAVFLAVLSPTVLKWRIALLEQGDTSAMKRQERLGYALDSFQQNPLFGLGTAANVGVHNDIGQMLANGGLVAVGLFLYWYGQEIWRAIRSLRQPVHLLWLREHAIGALVMLVMAGIALVVESFFNTEYVTVAFWFALAMVGRLLASDFLARNENE